MGDPEDDGTFDEDFLDLALNRLRGVFDFFRGGVSGGFRKRKLVQINDGFRPMMTRD